MSRRTRTGVGLALALALAGCGGRAPSMLKGRSPEAHKVAGVWWLMFVLAAAVYVVVSAFIVIAIVRGRRSRAAPAGEGTGGASTAGDAGPTADGLEGDGPSGPKDDTFIWLGGIVAPVIILAVLAVVTVNTTEVLRRPVRGELAIDVVGKRWWWDVSYPGTSVRTANEIHIPVGRTVDLRLTSDNVIHSFWVPQLAGKLDTIPGQRNDLRLKATRAGTYRGACAEYCGIEHAHMNFLVVADQPVEFERWLARRSGTAGIVPTSEEAARGQLVFMREACAGCHAIRGTAATATIGPDLSDFGSRGWIGSLTVPNTPSNLTRWITNSQAIKPGNLMPPIPISPDDLAAITAYLEGLK